MVLARKTEVRTLSPGEAEEAMKEIPHWLLRDRSIVREFRFADFREAMGFVNRVAEEAEAEDHHPDIFISYSMVKLELSTHKSGGLTEKDFKLAAKVDRLV